MELDKPLDIEGRSEELDELARSFDRDARPPARRAGRDQPVHAEPGNARWRSAAEQLKAAQKKLLQNDRLASLGQLSASVAHEINNPISGVLNLSMLMQRMLKDDGIPPNRIEEFRKYLGQVTAETAARRPHRLRSAGVFAPRQAAAGPADLNRIVRMTLSLVQHKMKLSNVDGGADVWPKICRWRRATLRRSSRWR